MTSGLWPLTSGRCCMWFTGSVMLSVTVMCTGTWARVCASVLHFPQHTRCMLLQTQVKKMNVWAAFAVSFSSSCTSAFYWSSLCSSFVHRNESVWFFASCEERLQASFGSLLTRSVLGWTWMQADMRGLCKDKGLLIKLKQKADLAEITHERQQRGSTEMFGMSPQ